MNAIAGLVSWRQSSADLGALAQLSSATCLLVPSRTTMATAGQAGAVSVSDQTAATTGLASLRGPGGHDVLVALDGRLDNRSTLLRTLADLGAGDGDSDAELVGRAYLRWDLEACRQLLGDFAVAIWDRQRARLLCARDPLGVRQLFVRAGTDGVAWASQLPPLASVDGSPAIDLEYVADLLAGGVPPAGGTRTPYRGIERLLPGHVLTADRSSVRVAPYWEWGVSPRIWYADSGDYSRHFRELFTRSVEARMRAAGQVWSDLSGGLDSSSITCVAAGLRSVQPASRPLSTITVAFEEASISDERAWTAHVEHACRLDAHVIDADRSHPFMRLLPDAMYWDEPQAGMALSSLHSAYRAVFGGTGGHALLSGAGAEAVVLGKKEGPIHFADLLREGAWRTLGREMRAWQDVQRVPFSNLLWRYALKPWITDRRISYVWQRSAHPWIRADFRRRFDVADRARRATTDRRRSPADHLHCEKISRVPGFLLRGLLDKACDIRYPFLDRTLVDFMLRVPWPIKLRASGSKPILRDAMAGVLPEPLRTRKTTTSFGHAVYLGIRKEWPSLERLVQGSRLADLGCISPAALGAALHLARCGHAPDLHGLMSTLCLEAWLQAHPAGATAGVTRPAA